MKVREVMTTAVATASPDDSFKTVVERMLERGVSSLPVIDDGKVVGIVSETDLIANEAFVPRKRGALALIAQALKGHDASFVRKASEVRVRALMTAEVIRGYPDETVQQAARRMLDFGVNHLPVLDNGRLVGIVSRQDLLATFCRPDAAIYDEIVHRLRDPLWAPDDVHVGVEVHDGVVTASGSVRNELDRAIVEHMLESTAGVVAVHAEIEVREPDPMLGPYLTPPLL